MALIAELALHGHTVVVVSHDPSIAASAARRIEMRDGRIVADSGAMRLESASVVQPAKQLGVAGRRSSFVTAVGAALKSLRSSPLRSGLSILSIVVGIGCLSTMLSLAEGAYVHSAQFIGGLGADRISVSGIGVSLTADDAEAIRQEVPSVRAVAPSLTDRHVVQYGDRQAVVELHATGAATLPEFMYEPYSLEGGIFLTDEDRDAGEQVVVIGPKLRESLFAPGSDPIGESILIGGVPFEVKGVLAPHPILHGPPYASSPLREVQQAWVPFRTGADLLFPRNARVSINVYVHDPARVQDVAKNIRDLLSRRHGRDGVALGVHQELLNRGRDLHRQSYLVRGGVGTLALLVGGLGVMATMLTSIGQRSREIGLRVAVGARRRDIVRQFLVEAAIVAAAGTVAGMLLAVATSPVIGALFEMPVAFAAWFVPAAVAVGVSVGVAAGVVPAMRAAKLDPVRALAQS